MTSVCMPSRVETPSTCDRVPRGACLSLLPPLVPRGALVKRSKPLRRTRLRSRSEKRSELYELDRRPRIEAIVASGVGCLIGPLFVDRGIYDHACSGRVEGLHERRKRSAGGSLVNSRNLIPACNFCNGWVEDNPAVARDWFGCLLVVREGDEEWEELGVRADR